jgi:hypothetical protein
MAAEDIEPISFKQFLESVPPLTNRTISDLGGKKYYSGGKFTQWDLAAPEIYLHCDSETCNGLRFFRSSEKTVSANGDCTFLSYRCRNCGSTLKTFALWVLLEGEGPNGHAVKFGEIPEFGPPTPARLIKLIGPQKDLFLKGRRAENQGLGIAAFAYYRRVIEDQKNRIFDQIIKVCERVGAGQATLDELVAAKAEMQFTKAVESIKHGIPQALLVNGHNPLTLLHSALSEGLHAQTDEECLELATSIRVVIADFAERMGQVMKDEAELNTAVTRLLHRKAKPALPATPIPNEGNIPPS